MFRTFMLIACLGILACSHTTPSDYASSDLFRDCDPLMASFFEGYCHDDDDRPERRSSNNHSPVRYR